MTIVPRNGKFGVKVWDSGQKRYRWIGSFDTEVEAAQSQRDATLKPGKDVPTVKQWGRVWLSDYAREAPSTQRSYRYAVKQIETMLGSRKISEITRPEARRIANGWPRATARVARTWGGRSAGWHLRPQPVDEPPSGDPEGPEGHRRSTEHEIANLADLAAELSGDYGKEARAIILTLASRG